MGKKVAKSVFDNIARMYSIISYSSILFYIKVALLLWRKIHRSLDLENNKIVILLTACFYTSRNYRVWIHCETRTWRDKNIQSNAPYR